MNGAHHVGGPGGRGLCVAAPDQGLGRKMQHHFGLDLLHQLRDQRGITNVAQPVVQAAFKPELGK